MESARREGTGQTSPLAWSVRLSAILDSQTFISITVTRKDYAIRRTNRLTLSVFKSAKREGQWGTGSRAPKPTHKLLPRSLDTEHDSLTPKLSLRSDL